MTEYQNRVYRLAYSLLGNAALAEEAAQETFLRVWKALPGFRGESSISSWIYTIARNTCLTLRKSRAVSETALDSAVIERMIEGQQPSAERAGTIDWESALANLPERYREVIVLFYMQDKSYEEVAAMLGLPMGTVKTYLYRAKKELATIVMRSKIGVRDGLSKV